MSEEEKQAIESVKNMFEGITIDSLNKDSKMTIYSLGIADILLFINAFEKQEKEIEELKKDKKALLDNYNKVLGTFISKDKIREKLDQIYEEYQQILSSNTNLYGKNVTTFQYNAMRTVLEELLEE